MRIKIGKFEDSEKGGGRMDDGKIKKILDCLAEEKKGWEQSHKSAERRLSEAYRKEDILENIKEAGNVEFFKGRMMEASVLETNIRVILGI